MKPVFLDFHIHTSANPEELNTSYNVNTLKSNIEKIASGSEYLISFSDHNTVNKSAYLESVKKIKNLLIGVELHVRNYDKADPYHCHILFNVPKIDEETIDDINAKLDSLYPAKVVKNDDKSIPKLEAIMNSFDKYDFILMPHGGQNHSTFDTSIPEGVEFDKTLERSIYYNHFEGFTARHNKGLERTHQYFERLGIKDFVNLITTTDNYNPSDYPNCKAGRDASEFVPTWMLASPTFDGLRLSLSESSRLKYGEKPDSWAECILKASLHNDNIDIDVDFTPGLNVIIGGSSSGKSLLVDSMWRKITGSYDDCVYLQTPYNIQDIEINNPAGQHPHYLDQNYISRICDPKDKDNNIDDISLLKSVFPSDNEERELIANGLAQLGSELSRLVESVKQIEILKNELIRIPKLSHLVVNDQIRGNPLKYILPDDKFIELVGYTKGRFDRDVKELDRIDKFLAHNPLVKHDNTLIDRIKTELESAYKNSQFEFIIREVIKTHEKEIDETQRADNQEITTKRKQFDTLLDAVGKFIKNRKIFAESLESISKFKIKISTKKIESMGHTLFIDNEFELTKEKFIEVVNGALKSEYAVSSFDQIKPECFFEEKFSKRNPKISDYDSFVAHVNAKFQSMNKKKYRIFTKEGKDFDSLSAGWKTSVILDLILGCETDNAPLIIDQPEDNLATSYINTGLLNAIKQCKSQKQIILVSHNATIPMLGDAQNIVMCENTDNKIVIRSSPLEGSIEGRKVVDLIAETTDGGKASVKKRFKKYNLKNYRGSNEASV